MTTRVSWLGRTFGWSGSREQRLALALAILWAAGLLVIGYLSANWSIGTTILAVFGWVLALAIVARNAVRDLFGPVFFYDLLRVSRNRLTFMLRGFYVVCLGAFLLLSYYDWIYQQSGYDSDSLAEMHVYGGVCALLFAGVVFRVSRDAVHAALRWILLAGAVVVGMALLIDGTTGMNARRFAVDLPTLPSSVVSRFAMDFFEGFVVVQFIVLTLLTPVYVAGTIAVEKERKTLEFLLATDLRNREIIFGKLAARVLTLVMYLFAGLPLIAFLQLFGGIDPEQLLAATTATFFTVLGLAALSIWVSTSLKKARDAIVITYLLVLVYGFVSFMLAVLTSTPVAIGWWNTPVTLLGVSLSVHDLFAYFADGNPFWAFFKMGPLRGGGINNVLRDYVVFWCVAIALLLGSAILRIRRVTIAQAYGPAVSRRKKTRAHPKVEGEQGKPFREEPETANPITRLIDGSGRRPEITGNPVTWKEVFVDATFRGGCLGRLVALLILVLTFVPLGLIFYYEFVEVSNYRLGQPSQYRWYRFLQEVNAWVRVVTGVLGFLMFIAVAIRGAGAITVEKDRDSWISLLSTPLSAEEILWGKWWGCVMSVRRAFLVLLIVWSVGLALGAVSPLSMLIMLPLTLIYVSAFSWVGLYCSMTARNTLVASVRGFFAALFCAGGFWIVLGLCCFLPLDLGRSRSNYEFISQVQSFFGGFTPPLVYGVFPLGDFDDRFNLGPFRIDDKYSAGLTGPIVGTLFWIVFSYAMYELCIWKCRQVTNRGRTKPESRPPARIDSSDSSRRTRES